MNYLHTEICHKTELLMNRIIKKCLVKYFYAYQTQDYVMSFGSLLSMLSNLN